MNRRNFPKLRALFALLIFSLLSVGTVWAQNAPTVTTNDATGITAITAKGNGNVTADGGATVTERGICWGTSQNPTISGNHLSSSAGTGYFAAELTGLAENTTYYVRAYATNSAGTAYGDNKTFTTKTIVDPVVTTLDVIHIRQNSAVGVARLTDQGNDPTTERGVCWSSSVTLPTLNNPNCRHAKNGVGEGDYSVSMSYIEPNTLYYMRAYAKNSKGTVVYGAVKTFHTHVHMQNGTIEVDEDGFIFTDSNADTDEPGQWYTHYEEYSVVFIPENSAYGVKIVFDSLLINNDFLYFYDGDIAPSNLIGVYTCNEYHAYKHSNSEQVSVFGLGGNIFTVTSHNYMTVRFVSDYHWRDFGWRAHVTQAAFTPQPPAVAKMACSDNSFVLLGTSKGQHSTTLKYSVGYGGAEPGAPSETYEEGTPININGDYPVKIKVMTEVKETADGDVISSAIKMYTFGDESKVIHPDAPTITGPAANSSTVTLSVVRPAALNDTWTILYTLNELEDPATSPTAQAITSTTEDPITHEVTTSGTVALPEFCMVRAVVIGTTCPEAFSEESQYLYDDTHTLYLLPPAITFDGTGSSANTIITPSTSGCTIHYTINGGEEYTYTDYSHTFVVNANDRVEAWVTKDGPYVVSPHAVATYLPSGSTPGSSSGLYGDVVYLDDRESHSLSYYSDGSQPVFSLHPVDVKITYFGNGIGNMTDSTEDGDNPTSFSANATGVMVGVAQGETQNTFVYNETLESSHYEVDDYGYTVMVPDYEGANNEYTYTTIPNPFSVRPMYTTVTSTRNIYVRGTIQSNAFGYINVTYTDVNNTLQTWSGYINWSQQQGSIFPEATLQVLAGTTVSFSLYTSNGGWADNGHIGCEVRYDNADGDVIWTGIAYYSTNGQNNPVTGSVTVQEGGPGGGQTITFTDYRGFYAWRVKRLQGVTIKDAYGNTYDENSTIFAETRLIFQIDNEYGNEVDFEALWAKAYVGTVTSNPWGQVVVSGLNTNVSYERNFVVGVTRINALNVPATYSSYYPDGTPSQSVSNTVTLITNDNNGNYTDTDRFFLYADMKFENMNFSYTQRIVGNNHYLCFGRGINTVNVPYSFEGVYTDNDHPMGPLDYTIRVESGRFNMFSFISDTYTYGNVQRPINGRYLVKGIMGSDYDRAQNDNSKLRVCCDYSNDSLNMNRLFLCYGIQGNGIENKDIETFSLVVKGGTYQESYWEYGGNGRYDQSFYVGQNFSSGYPGVRYITVKGGDFGSMNGGRGTSNYDHGHVDPNVVASSIRIKGGKFHGSVFGGAADNMTPGSRRIVITGRQDENQQPTTLVQGWVAGGCNGTGENGEMGCIDGNSYIYVGGKTVVGSEPSIMVNGTEGGNVFGAGRGVIDYWYTPPTWQQGEPHWVNQIAYVHISNVVVADDAFIFKDVYGGGFHGYVTDTSNVFIVGGTVGNNVYGGAFQHGHTDPIPATRVHIRDGNVLGSVFGGSNTLGNVGLTGANPEDDDDNNAVVWMTGGTVGTTGSFESGCVFGGSDGINTKVLSNTRVHINGGLVVNNVYGGGNLGQVEGKATVKIEGGEVGDEHDDVNPTKGNVYGGGKGVAAAGGDTYVNEAEVDILDSYIMGSVFGGGENGHVLTNTVVNVNGGQVGGYPGDIFGEGEHADCANPYHGSVYGGGSGLNLDSNGNMVGVDPEDGWVKGNSTVNIVSGAHILRNVYGGSNVASVGLTAGTETIDGKTYLIPVPYTGLATVNISGGIIGTDGEDDIYNGIVASNGMVFGSSHGKAVIGDLNYAHVNSTHVTISAGADIRGSVFGGGDDGFVLDSTFVEIMDGTIGTPLTAEECVTDDFGSGAIIYRGNVYGGGRGIDPENGQISTIAGFVKKNTRVMMTGGLVRHNVYGGGSLACVGFKDRPETGIATVYINGGQVGSTGLNNGRVFGSGRGMPATPGDDELMKYASLAFTNNTYVTVEGTAKVMGSVYGGGENGHVAKKTTVTVDGVATIGSEKMYPFTGNVFGGGRGVDRYGTSLTDFSRTAGKVYEQTEVNINGGQVYHAVYGGGTMASVGQIITDDGNGGYGTPSDTPIYYGPDDETVADAETGFLKLRPDIDNNGLAVVNINHGAIVGDDGDGDGMVFGSARGMAGADYKHFAYTGNTDVNINGGQIMGSVYGGGENGHVLGSTDVDVVDGTIGFVGSHNILMGNVFGGGCGTDLDLSGNYSRTAGWVKFNTNVTIEGAQTYRNVYGGGNLASVGIAENHDAEFSGRANVIVKDGVVGSDGNENGHVFGSGYGRPAGEGNQQIFSELAFVKNSFVTIQDNADVKGSVFGSGENGHVRQNTHVFVTGGTIGIDGTTGYEGNVYGGGRGKDQIGGEFSITSGRTYGNTFVDLSGGKVNGSVYGGGRMASVGTYPERGDIPADPDYNNGAESGRSTVYIHGDVIIGNENTAIRGGNVYGGAKGLVGSDYAQLAYLKNTEVIIDGATITGSVFGGGENGHVSENTKVVVNDGTIGFDGGNEYKGNVFGGGRGIDRDASGNQTETAGIVQGSTRVFFEGGTAYGSVFGGGNASLVSLEKVVNINSGTVKQDVFGGCKQVSVEMADKHPGTKTVNMRGGQVNGSVYGCSNKSIDGNFEPGHEKDWTAFVNISGGTILGSVHGLGYAGEVNGSSLVNIGVNAIAEKVDGEWSDLSKRNVYNIYFDDRAYLPTVLTSGVFDVTGTTAEVDSYVTSIGESDVTERGICLGTETNPTQETEVDGITGDGRGYYSYNLSGLTAGTKYYVRAYAKNDKGTAYGAEISFTTNAAEPEFASGDIDRDEHEGKIAIENAVSIGNSVYAGSNYFGTQGSNVNDWTHHDATGYTNIYIDGTEYNTASNSGNSMNIGGGVFGSGTHCEAGLSGHNVLMREYGHRNTENNGHGDEFTEATRSLTTIQRCQNLLLDNVNINLTGLNDINTTYSTSKIYSVVKVDEVMYLTNASALSVGGEAGPAYMDSIHCLRSMHLNIPAGTTIYDELYALEDGDLTPAENDETKQHYDNIQNLEWIAVNPLTGGENTAENARLYYVTSAPTTPLDYEQENVILFNNFSQLWVRYHKDEPNTKYGELQGFIRMDSDYEPYGTESFAFARPKITGAKNNNILTGNPAHPYLYENDNVVDGGFLSYKVDNLGVDYEHGYNFFTLQDNLGGWDYPADGDDGGDDYTKTKQYPYINVYPLTREDRDFYRMWVIPRPNGALWYVDGRGVGEETGGWGKDLNHQDGWGHFPDKPKLTVSFNAGEDDAHNGIIYDRTRTIPDPSGQGQLTGPYKVFDPSKDIIYVVGPVSALKEEAGGEININRNWEGEYTLYPNEVYQLDNYKLKLFRYPGGHMMSNGKIDGSETTTPLTQDILGDITFEAYNGLPAGVTTGPGANYNAMIDVDSISDSQQGNITLNNVLVDGLYGHTQIDDSYHQIPTSFDQDAVHKPLVVMGAGTTLTLKSVAEPDDLTQEGTELQRCYNNTKADYYYDPDYDADADDDPDIVFATRHGGAVYVHRYATMNAEGKVTVKDNLQNLDQIVYNEDGEEAGTTPVKIESNVYLPTFKKHTYITGELDQSSRIGITSPIRNAEPHFTQNTMSPIAEATDATIAYNAWNNENYYDDLARFFYRGYEDDFKTTYYEQSAANYSPLLADAGDDETIEKTLYFGWTWNNVVTRKPAEFSYDNIDSPEDLAWLISLVNGLNGRVANDLSAIDVIEEKTDIDLVQYVWLPVGDRLVGTKPFGGKFDGRGHIIENLSIAYLGNGDGRYNRNNYGMFGVVDGGVVDRTFVLSGYIEPVSDLNYKGMANMGTLVGMLGTDGASKPASMVSNSEGGADIVCAQRDNDFNVGSVIGYMVEGELHSSMGMSDITAMKAYPNGGYVGGLVGRAEPDVEGKVAKINNSFSNSKMTFGQTSMVSAGGLVGYNVSTMQNCYSRLQEGSAVYDKFKLLAFETMMPITLGHSFQMPVYEQAGFDQGWGTAESMLIDCYHYTNPKSADFFRYIYNDNKLQKKEDGSWKDIEEDESCLLFNNLNQWVEDNNGEGHKYSLWVRPTITGINDDFPILHLCDWNSEGKQGLGDFRNMATWHGGPKLQYAGPVRDFNELNSMIERMGTNDYMYVYGDIAEEVTADIMSEGVYKPAQLSVYEHAAILHPGTLAEHPQTYVGVTFDNSCGHAYSTPEINHMDNFILPRDWHMFSSSINNAPLGFNYEVNGVNTNLSQYYPENPTGAAVDNGDYYNNPWPYLHQQGPYGEFTWLNNAQSNDKIRYWMKGWENSQSLNVENPEIDEEKWVDGYFPSRVDGASEFSNSCIETEDEYGRFPYGMDMFCWYEPEPHWINFKRNGPNHWHSDEYEDEHHLHAHLPYTENGIANQNEDELVFGKGYMFAIAEKTYLQSHGYLNANSNTRDRVVTNTNSAFAGSIFSGWNLVGNPYHAYLDFEEFASDNNIGSYYVIYDADGYQDGPSSAYLYYPQTGSNGGAYADQFLHPHQGFFVKSTDGSALSFNEGMTVTRDEASNSAFRSWKPNYPLVNLYLNSEKGCSDVTVIEFHRPEWGGARKQRELRQGNGLLYAYNDEEPYAALFVKEGAERVPLWFEAKDTDVYTMTWNTANGDFSSLYLIDNLTGTRYDMLNNDSYVFEGKASDYHSRFYITFNCVDVEENDEDTETNIAFFDGSQWVVTGEGNIELIDLQGRVLWNSRLSGGQSRVSVPNVAAGLYLFRLTNANETKVQKIIIK